MIQLRKIDENGMFLEDVIAESIPYLTEIVPEEQTDAEGNPVVVDTERPLLDEFDNPVPDPQYIETPVPDGLQLWHPKWTGTEWVEGMSQEQIDELQNQPQQITPEQEELKALKVRQNETENAMMTLMELTMMGGM